MSNRDDSGNYIVGRGKPSTVHQWPPGTSGNPKGRPPKIRTNTAGTHSRDANDLILAEAERVIRILDKGEEIEAPAAQGLIRKMMAIGGNGAGNEHALRTFLNWVLKAQEKRDKAKVEKYILAYGLKLDLQDVRDRWVAAGKDEKDMLVHPSDIEIDALTGDVNFFIALSDEEKAAREILLQMLEDAHTILARSIHTIAEEGPDDLLEFVREMNVIKIHFANELLPPRFRRSVPAGFGVSQDVVSMFMTEFELPEPLKSKLAKRLGYDAGYRHKSVMSSTIAYMVWLPARTFPKTQHPCLPPDAPA